jgi:hypothetical protein
LRSSFKSVSKPIYETLKYYFLTIKEFKPKFNSPLLKIIVQKQKTFLIEARKAVLKGDMITKVNYGNGKKSVRFFQVSENGFLRWAKTQKDMENSKKYKICKKS